MVDPEVVRPSQEPTVVLDESLRRMPFEIEVHPAEFGRLARRVGIAESEIGNVRVTLVDGRTIYPILGSYYPETKEIKIGIPSRRRNAPHILNTTAHEFDHYNYFLTHAYTPHIPTRRERIVRKIQDAALTIPYVGLYVGLYLITKGTTDYYFADEELHARKTAREVTREAEERGISYNLITVTDKPKARRTHTKV